MRKCKSEVLIDSYLLNRLDEDEKKKFEDHYFNCPYCFEKMVERDELISLIKDKGDAIFQDEYAVEEKKRATWIDKTVSLLAPRQWAAVAVSACLLLFISLLTFYFVPNFKETSHKFFIAFDPDVRAKQIKIELNPPVDLETVPPKISWSKVEKPGKDVEYRVYIYDNWEELWRDATRRNFIILPEEIKRRMISGRRYSCQVKAFSPDRGLIASGEIQFKIR